MTTSEMIAFLYNQARQSLGGKPQKYMEIISVLKEKQAQEERFCLSESVLHTIYEYLGVTT